MQQPGQIQPNRFIFMKTGSLQEGDTGSLQEGDTGSLQEGDTGSLQEGDLNGRLFEQREAQLSHDTYDFEQQLLQAIRLGELDNLQIIQAQGLPVGIGRLSPEPLRQYKNLMICLTTLAARAAIDGGLLPEEAFTLSDIYISHTENCPDVAAVDKLLQQMLIDFTTRVFSQNHLNQPGHAIRRCCDYIFSHLHDPINRLDLARLTGFSETYLSRLFHQETGQSIPHYIQQERIGAACNLLRFSDYSITEISQYLCFSTPSLFCSCFQTANRSDTRCLSTSIRPLPVTDPEIFRLFALRTRNHVPAGTGSIL